MADVVILNRWSNARHALAPDWPAGLLCNLGITDGRRLTGALSTGTVSCWACRTILAGDNPADPNAPARPRTVAA